MKKMIIALNVVLAFAMFNRSAIAGMGTCHECFESDEYLHTDCDCYDYECSGYRWYYSIVKCYSDDCLCDYICDWVDISPDTRAWRMWTEYECYTPRFGCQGEGAGEGEECNEGDPMFYFDLWNKKCQCVPK